MSKLFVEQNSAEQYFLTTVKRKKYICVKYEEEYLSKLKTQMPFLTSVARGPVVYDYEDGLM